MRNRWACIVASVILVTLAAPAVARAQGRNPGPTPMGRRGYQWEAAQRAAKEDQKRMETELAAMSENDWKAHALAWIELSPAGADKQLQVPGSNRVAGLEVKKGDVQAAKDTEGSWTIAWTRRKAPKEVTLVLTDVAATKVKCPLRDAVEDGDVALGIFQNHSGILVCVPRKKS